MERHRVVVMTEDEIKIKRGVNADAMLYCQRCEKHQGVFLSKINILMNINADGKQYSRIVWERWRCLNCRNLWIEKYGVEVKNSDKPPEATIPPSFLPDLNTPGCGDGKSLRRAVQLKIEALA